MSKPSKVVVCALLACASACVALPLYRETFRIGSGWPQVTVWAAYGSPFDWSALVVRTPVFWALPALSLGAAALAAVGRRKSAACMLGVLLSLFVIVMAAGRTLFRSSLTNELTSRWIESHPEPVFYRAMAAVVLALIVIVWPRGSSAPPPARP